MVKKGSRNRKRFLFCFLSPVFSLVSHESHFILQTKKKRVVIPLLAGTYRGPYRENSIITPREKKGDLVENPILKAVEREREEEEEEEEEEKKKRRKKEKKEKGEGLIFK